MPEHSYTYTVSLKLTSGVPLPVLNGGPVSLELSFEPGPTTDITFEKLLPDDVEVVTPWAMPCMTELDSYWEAGVQVRRFCARPVNHRGVHAGSPSLPCFHARGRGEGEPIGVLCELEDGHEGPHDYPSAVCNYTWHRMVGRQLQPVHCGEPKDHHGPHRPPSSVEPGHA